MSLGDEHEASGGYGGTGQTRTRLPDTGTDPYGSTRRGRSSSRSLVTVVGVVVLLIAAIAFANRGDDTTETSDSGTNKPDTAATAPSGKRPVQTKSGGGIPSGFAQDQEGAESAAANYAVVLVSADILKPARRPEMLRQVFDAGRVSELERNFDRVYDKAFLDKVGLDQNGDAPKGSTYVSRTMPVGTKATEYSGNAATVEVWCTGVYGMTGDSSENPVTSDWFTMTLQLRWTDGDWKVDSFSQKEGPAPVNGDNKVSTSDDITKAVQEFGGFTYAR
ncbi:integral membrane protein [Streptomyces viridochromogenes DSM 40736]|uniref:Integral membrane protein n=1 Tax=Streptomyces viridochromogenes (strain DSM 40736 / JCM 4977 / BCRC 1201 / Tue 494) TaxID=591159 RepID=D9WXX1_STRVT|nr:hypothetical protein [Streptomyces viridochromogenes]EFL33166.1 integral membrane protein [Streptomyces viridochromogenes DSM 40736]